MNNLTRFDTNGIEIFIDLNGTPFASISGTARMANRNESTIRRFITSRKIDVIKAEIDTGYGKKLHAMLSSRSICKVLAQYNTDRLIEFAELGIRTALYQIAGYQPAVQEELCPQILPTTSAQDNLRDWGNALIQGVPGTNIHPDTKLPAPIVTCRDLGQYLLERLFFLVGLAEEDPSTWDTPKFRIAAASMAGSPTAKLLPVPNDHRTLGKGFGKTKK